MRVWRISNYADLSGLGGLSYSARWHTRGRPIIYAAEHPAGALAEFLVHLSAANLPESFQLLTIDAAEDVAVSTIDTVHLQPGWTSDEAITRSIGDHWLAKGSGVLLRVPSVIVPDAMNVLINPRHPDMDRVRIVKSEHVPLDRRLKI